MLVRRQPLFPSFGKRLVLGESGAGVEQLRPLRVIARHQPALCLFGDIRFAGQTPLPVRLFRRDAEAHVGAFPLLLPRKVDRRDKHNRREGCGKCEQYGAAHTA